MAKIEAAKQAISDAEDELQKVVEDITPAPRAEKAEVGEGVRAAASKVSAAKAHLVDLEQSLALAKLEGARTALDDAEKYLDEVLGEMVVVAGTDKTWVGKVVKDAFTKLRAAKTTLERLESAATDKD